MIDNDLKKWLLFLYPWCEKVYSYPPRKEDGRKIIHIVGKDSKQRKVMQLAKALLQIKLNRLLYKDEEVDHIDGNCENDSLNNLQVLSKIENAKKDAKRRRPIHSKCILCEKEFELTKKST